MILANIFLTLFFKLEMFSRISDVSEQAKQSKPTAIAPVKDEPKTEEVKNESKPKIQVPKPVIYLLVILFVVAVIGIVAAVMYINHRNDLKKTKSDLEIANHTQKALKAQLEQQNAAYQSLYDEHQQALSDYSDLENAVSRALNFDLNNKVEDEPNNNKPLIDVPTYEVGDGVYDDSNPDAVKRKVDPRVQKRDYARKLAQQYRPTVEDTQETIKQRLEEQQQAEDAKIQAELKQLNNASQALPECASRPKSEKNQPKVEQVEPKATQDSEDELVDDDELMQVLG